MEVRDLGFSCGIWNFPWDRMGSVSCPRHRAALGDAGRQMAAKRDQ